MVKSREFAILAAGTGTQDLAILESPPAFAPGGGQRRPAILRFTANRLNVIGNDSKAGLLVLLDSYAEGWTAPVNVSPAPIVPAYGAFRGVEVPAGRWEVAMTYRVPRLQAGLMITVAALLIALLALCVSRPVP